MSQGLVEEQVYGLIRLEGASGVLFEPFSCAEWEKHQILGTSVLAREVLCSPKTAQEFRDARMTSKERTGRAVSLDGPGIQLHLKSGATFLDA